MGNIDRFGTIDTITLIGIGNGSISRDLYLRNLCGRQNPLKYNSGVPEALQKCGGKNTVASHICIAKN